MRRTTVSWATLVLAGMQALAAPVVAADPPSPGGEVETRCGWLENPTPANLWLTDRDGEWIINVQGGHQAEMDTWPEFAPGQWVVTNGVSYGYGCACLKLVADPRSRLVVRVLSAAAKPLSACRQDKAIKHDPRKARAD